jgi:endonuclease-3
MAKLGQQHPNADTELNFSTAYELLVATILSAQCTDERVNQVTPALFKRYPDARALARATTSDLEPQIQSTGFFRAKSRSLVGMAIELVERHGGTVPATMEELVKLPGVGRKTANVVLGHALGVPGLPVDRHVLRVSNRIGIARSDDPEIVEQQLCAAMPPAEWTLTSDTLILHGRRICKPRPLCDRCVVRAECEYYQKVIRPSAIAASGAKGPRKGTSKPARAAGPPENRSETGAALKHPPAVKPRGTARGGGPPENPSESSHSLKHPQAAKPQGTAREGMPPNNRSESTHSPKHPRAAKPQGIACEGTPPGNRSGSTHSLKHPRAAKPQGIAREGMPPNNRSESTHSPKHPRAAKPRGTARGGGAPREIKE